MSHPHDSDSDDGADVRTALATLVAHEPDLPAGSADIERRGRRRQAVRRLGGGVAAAVILATAGVTTVGLMAGEPAAPDQVAQPPDVTAPVDTTDPAGSTLVQGFPVGSAVDAVARALPAGANLAELPMEIGWREGGLLDVPVTLGPVSGPPGPPTHLVTIQVVDGVCSATVEPAGALSGADLDAIATSVCAEWVATGSLPVIPADPSGEEQPDLAAQ